MNNYSISVYRPPLPAAGENDGRRQATLLRTFIDHMIRYETTKRVELERHWNRARMYDAGRQWIRPLRNSGGSRLWFAWEPIRFTEGGSKFPMPVRNVFARAIQDEVARLVGVGSKPYVRVDDPEKAEGAVKAKHVLVDRNEKTGWERQNRRGAYHAAIFGQWIETVWWEVNFLKTGSYPKTDVAGCRDCGFMLAGPEVSREEAQSLPGQAAIGVIDQQAQKTQFFVENCPTCAQPLRPMSPPEEVWRTQQDSLGRPLAQELPMGEDLTGIVSPYSFFPQNQGIGYETDDEMEEYAIRTPRSIPYFRAHYLNGKEIKPDRGFATYRHHPVVTSFGITYAVEGIWDNHNMEDVYVQKPTEEFPKGRFVVMAGPILLYDGDYLIEGTDIPRRETLVAQWELRESEIWGKSLAEDLFSTQDNINTTISQKINIRDKHANPRMVIHEGMHFDFDAGANSRYQSDIWTVNTRGIPPEVRDQYPKFFGNAGPAWSFHQDIEEELNFVSDISGARNPEIGNVSGVELNYSALLFAAQKSGERRRPRNDGLRSLKRRIWSTRLRHIAYFYREDRLIHYRDDSDKEAVQQIRGFHLQDQTDVALEDEPYVDSAIAVRASIQQGLDWGTIRTSANGGSYGADRKINHAIGVPEDLNSDRNTQEDGASSEWKEHYNEDIEPMIDQQADLHDIHRAMHDLSFSGRDGDKLKEQMLQESGIRWPMVLRATWEWERLFSQLNTMAQAVREAPDPEKLLTMVEHGVMGPEEAVEIPDKIDSFKLRLIGFPSVLELQIQHVWIRLLEAHGIKVTKGSALWKLVRFKAHILGHWKLMVQATAPMGGAPPGPGAAGPGAPGPTMDQAASPSSVPAPAA